jgi:hypothetical protein
VPGQPLGQNAQAHCALGMVVFGPVTPVKVWLGVLHISAW